MSSGSYVVDKVGEMHLEGNVIPHNWYRTIKTEAGKPDTIGIILLAEIVYWYRPTYIRDEFTGQLIGTKKKFKADKLQKKTQDLAEQFGFSKRQVLDALSRLEKSGIIVREFRNIHTRMGVVSNIQFIDLNLEKLTEVTYATTLCEKTHEGITETQQGCPQQITAYTEITTENTTKNIDDEEEAPVEKFNLFMEYKTITGKTPNGIQSKLLMEWIAKFPSDVLQEGLKRMQEGTPDNPFNYLKKIMEYWEQKGLFTLQAIYREDEKFKLNNQKPKGANQQPTNGGPTMVNGHVIDF